MSPEATSGTSADPCRDSVLTALADICANRAAHDDIVSEALEAIVASLRLGGATLSLVREHEGGLNLEPIAAVGSHAVFAREMSARPLASLVDAATVIADGHAVFIGENSGPVGPQGPAIGVGRWRSALNAHATAILPVKAWGQTLGVLSIEWPHSGPVSERDRAVLDAIAGLLGLMVHEVQGRPGNRSVVAVEHMDVVRHAGLAITGEGVILPHAAGELVPRGTVAHVVVAARADAVGRNVPFWDVVSTGVGHVALSLGMATGSSGGAHSLAEACSQALRMLSVQGVPPATALGYLAGTVRMVAPAGGRAGVAVVGADLSGPAVALTFAAAGDTFLAIRSSDGRITTHRSSMAAVAGSYGVSAEEVHLLLLPGDHVAILAMPGDVGVSGDLDHRLKDAFAGCHERDELADRLHAVCSGGAEAGAALVISVAEPSETA